MIYVINRIVPKDNQLIIAFADYEIVDGEVVPYHSDNVHILLNHIKEIRKDIKIIYISSNQFGGKVVLPNSLWGKIKLSYYRLRAKVYIFKQPPSISEHFTKDQHLLCLGYFIPFKADYLDLTKWWVFYNKIFLPNYSLDQCKQYGELVLNHYTYRKHQFDRTNLTYITPSRYASKALGRSHGLAPIFFKELGSLKSDQETVRRRINLDEIYGIKDQKVILYTPTFRDKYIGRSVIETFSSIFGYENEQTELESFLIEHNIVVLIKLHKGIPYYRELEQMYMQEDKSYFANCYFLDFETEAKYGISVYNLFEQSDAMIADYSSISFDYLPYDKPIIYNVPDIEEYRDYRGFSYEPIEEMMPGDQTRSIKEFKEALLKVAKGEDTYHEKRMKVLGIVNEIPQGKALENISNYVLGLLD